MRHSAELQRSALRITQLPSSNRFAARTAILHRPSPPSPIASCAVTSSAAGSSYVLAAARGRQPAKEDRVLWHCSETGSGRPLILLHGIGMSHAAWNAVTPYLCSTRRVIAFDIAGFGLTPPLPGGTPATIANLVEGLARSIHEMGVEFPVDMAGNSLGASMALEAAKRGMARSVVAISPAGLWREHGAPHVKYVFGGMRFMAKNFPCLLKFAVRMAAAAGTRSRGACLGGKQAHAHGRCASRSG